MNAVNERSSMIVARDNLGWSAQYYYPATVAMAPFINTTTIKQTTFDFILSTFY